MTETMTEPSQQHSQRHSQQDIRYMALALQLAAKGLYTTAPNPRVGCVLVKDDQIVGSGWHRKAGEAHAEINAIKEAGSAANGATAYVTLEPCSHYGRTPPCADALIKVGVKKAVIAMQDPNPVVAGRGIEQLRQADIDVSCGLMAEQSQALNPGFIKRMETGQPWLRCKMAMSLDGRTAMASGESQWITASAARQEVQRLRARSCAIVTGIDSVLQDDCSLTVRADELGISEANFITQRQPQRVVVDSRLRIPLSAKILKQAGRTLIVTANENKTLHSIIQQRGADVICLPGEDGKVDLAALMDYLAEKQFNEILLETGSRLAGSALQARLIDELRIYLAPKLLGSEARPLFQLPLQSMADQLPVDIEQIRAVGPDWCIEAKPRYQNEEG